MKNKWCDPGPILEWLKENYSTDEIIEAVGTDELIDHIGAKQIAARIGTDLLGEFTQEEAVKYFDLELRDDDYK